MVDDELVDGPEETRFPGCDSLEGSDQRARSKPLRDRNGVGGSTVEETMMSAWLVASRADPTGTSSPGNVDAMSSQ
jgi:hypothetical protein